jgi:hypothetical protein
MPNMTDEQFQNAISYDALPVLTRINNRQDP